MRSNIKLGKISGIEIGLHYSWFLIAGLIVFSLGEHFRQVNPNWSTAQIWIVALLTGLLFFGTLLLHELSHSLVAQRRGLKVKEITLFALGGVSQIERDAPDAKTEFRVAIAGPIASLIIGFVCLAVSAGLGWKPSVEPRGGLAAVFVWLGYINIGLAVFNLLPAFPLDGGRVLRSIIWAITKSAESSTHLAARIGEVMAFLLIFGGIWEFFAGAGFNGLWTAFIGWFLMEAAKGSYAEVEISSAFRGMRVANVMSRDYATVDRNMTLEEFVDNYLLRTGERCFAVESHGRLAGLITARDVGAVPRERWDETTVGKAMRPLDRLHVIAPDTQVTDALKVMTANDVNQLPVVVNGTLQGILSRSHLMQVLQARSELQPGAKDYPAFHRTQRKGAAR
jgi:Zn-dependent protease/predicted transcriptional regulator